MKSASDFRVQIVFTLLLSLIISSCEKEDKTLPVILTINITNITQTSAQSGGNVKENGGTQILARGICWNTSGNPTINDSKTIETGELGSFVSSLISLKPAIKYYVCAYATNEIGTAYGEQVTFTTNPVTTCTIMTAAVTLITRTSAVSGGNIASDGGGSITDRGVCWSTTNAPTVSGNKTTNGSGMGSFISNISGLQPGTTYYIRSYASNSAGTKYGDELSFTTAISLATVTTAPLSEKTIHGAKSGGNIASDGGFTVTARGVCWSTSIEPTVMDSKTLDGAGGGEFKSIITGLAASTTYFVRAYATNIDGTAYGTTLSFETLPPILPILTTSLAGSISISSAVVSGEITSDGGSTVTNRGICWGEGINPIIDESHTNNGSGTGSFTGNLTSLNEGTSYYARAYATNSVGTSYGDQVYFITYLSDIEGNIYKTNQIGTQVWISENLKSKKLNDGSVIPLVEDNITWINLTSPAYCWHNNDAAKYEKDYGKLYDWYAVNTGKLCPSEWHVPTRDEIERLIDYLGGSEVAGGKMKESGFRNWLYPNTGATNESGFTGLPGGARYDDAEFWGGGSTGMWWSFSIAEDYDTNYSFGFYLNTYSGYYSGTVAKKNFGFSVRCIRNTN